MSVDACGGDPSGVWRATMTEVAGVDVFFISEERRYITCRGYVESYSGGEYLVEFADGGAGKIARTAPEMVVVFNESCFADEGASCEEFEEDDCELLECGACRCLIDDHSSLYGEGGTWVNEESTLTIDASPGADVLDYCVAGETMVQVSQTTGFRYTLEKVHLTGAPPACAERSKETCSNGCSLGQCVGSGDCDLANDESTCVQYLDCAWDPEICRGEAAVTCRLSDYLRGLPGCEILTGTPTCAGTPDACMSQLGCQAEGCGLGAACVGGEHPCTFLDEGVPGCNCQDGECEGTFQCAALTDSEACLNAGASDSCRWSTIACVGTPVDCSELGGDQCQNTKGCVLEAE